MGKKKKEEMDKQKALFLEGAAKKDIDPKIADSVFDLMAFFAGYGFNRSHSAAYGWVTYQTAYLKHHYPHEFMAGLMSCDADNIDNIVKFIAEARAMGLTVERPDINESDNDFTVATRAATEAKGKAKAKPADKVIRFGLGAVKGVGTSAVDVVLESRAAEGAFTSLYDFCRRVDTQKANRRVIEALIKAGAFDGPLLEGGNRNRAQLIAAIDTALERGASEQRDKRSGQTSLFGLIDPPKSTPGVARQGETYPDVEPWGAKQLLAFEKEALGFYVSGHPLDRYRSELGRWANATTADFAEGRRQPGEAGIGGIVSQYREMITKKGDKMARFVLEDQAGTMEVVVFPKTFEKVRHVLVSDEPILCLGEVRNEGTAEGADWKMMMNDAQVMAELRQARTTRVDIHLNADAVTGDQLSALRGILEGARGPVPAVLRLTIPRRSETVIPLGDRFYVAPSDELLARLERLFGERVATLA
jgi:DNA polymerase-3 subunit alpha